MSKRTADELEMGDEDLSYIIKHKIIQDELAHVLNLRSNHPDGHIVLGKVSASMDELLDNFKVSTGSDDVVYLLNSVGDEQTFVVHGVIGFALLPINSVLKGLNNNARRIVHRILLVDGDTDGDRRAREALDKFTRIITTTSGGGPFVKSQRQYSVSGLSALCFDAPLFTEKTKASDETALKESVDVPYAMDPKGIMSKFLSLESNAAKYAFTDDNVVEYGEFEREPNNKCSLRIADAHPDDVRVGHAIEVVFSLRGVRLFRGERIVRNHLSSVTILSRKGVPLLSEKKIEEGKMTGTSTGRVRVEKHIPTKKRRTDPLPSINTDGITKGIKLTTLNERTDEDMES